MSGQLLDRAAAVVGLDRAAEAVRGHAYRFTSERELQDGLARVLDRLGVAVHREHSLNAKDRPDFFLEGGLVVEVKCDGSPADLVRQVFRYAQHPAVHAILVVVSLRRLTALPSTMNDKPVRVAFVGGV